MPKARGSAQITYNERRNRIADLLDRFRLKLEGLDAKQKADPKNWGYAGDLEHYSNLLEDALGIEYRTEIDEENREVEVTRRYDGAQVVFTFDELLPSGAVTDYADAADAAIAEAKDLDPSEWG